MTGFGPLSSLEPTASGVRLALVDAGSTLPELFRRLDGDGLAIRGLALSEPTLADVFLRYTGREIRTEAADRPIESGWWG